MLYSTEKPGTGISVVSTGSIPHQDLSLLNHILEGNVMTNWNGRALVDGDWLAEHIDDPDLRIIDATVVMTRSDKFIAHHQYNARAHYLKGGIYIRAKKPNLAAAPFRRAIELKPEWRDPYLQLGQILVSRRDTLNEGLSLLQTGYALTKQDEEIGTLLALVQEGNGRIDGALKTFEAILNRNPKHQLAANNFAALIADQRLNDPDQLKRALAVMQPYR
ncbi:MAG: hypothetical protein HOF11_03975, partial [Rhodospirillaceae bacterium]|nr:hypothetical protein [Rhodospirillaceae bacterium]